MTCWLRRPKWPVTLRKRLNQRHALHRPIEKSKHMQFYKNILKVRRLKVREKFNVPAWFEWDIG